MHTFYRYTWRVLPILLFVGLFLLLLFTLYKQPNDSEATLPRLSLAELTQAPLSRVKITPSISTQNSRVEAILNLVNQPNSPQKKGLLLHYFASWCAVCYEELPFITSLRSDFWVVGIAWKDEVNSLQKMPALSTAFDAIWLDNDSELAIALGVFGVPETFLFDKNLKLQHKTQGILDKKSWQSFQPYIANPH